tara:strand:+ start:2818 stop:3111 length:294 start_codon:yes stop_codon:yes gene_type:complete
MKNRVIVETWKNFLNENIETNQFGIDQFSQNELVQESEKQQAIDLICSKLKDKLQAVPEEKVEKINQEYTMYKFDVQELGISLFISADGMLFANRIR